MILWKANKDWNERLAQHDATQEKMPNMYTHILSINMSDGYAEALKWQSCMSKVIANQSCIYHMMQTFHQKKLHHPLFAMLLFLTSWKSATILMSLKLEWDASPSFASALWSSASLLDLSVCMCVCTPESPYYSNSSVWFLSATCPFQFQTKVIKSWYGFPMSNISGWVLMNSLGWIAKAENIMSK